MNETDNVAVVLEEMAGAAGVRRIPKSGQIRVLTTEAINQLYTAEDTTALERAVYERELKRREKDVEWETATRGQHKCEVKIARALVAGWLHRFIVGDKTAAQAAWEVSRVLKMTYKDAELVIAGGYGFHDAEGVEVNQGMANATLARNTIPPACAGAWLAVFDGSPADLAALSDGVKLAIAKNDPTRALPKQKRVAGERAVRAPRAAKVKMPVSAEQQAAYAQAEEDWFDSL